MYGLKAGKMGERKTLSEFDVPGLQCSVSTKSPPNRNTKQLLVISSLMGPVVLE